MGVSGLIVVAVPICPYWWRAVSCVRAAPVLGWKMARFGTNGRCGYGLQVTEYRLGANNGRCQLAVLCLAW
jgi:hypothetical protein